jgi:two-component system, sensor histidine kinase and response regulator
MTDSQKPNDTSRKLNILLTEDNLVNRVLAQKLLTLANNGKEGATVWEANRASQFDVILMDIQMPLMDGIQATAYVREKETAAQLDSPAQASSPTHIPIVAMTAHAMKGDRERYLASGMDAYVSKPINSAELERVIQSVVASFPSGSSVPVTIAKATLDDLKEVPVQGIEEAEILARFDGDADLVRELAEIFIKECPKYLSDIHEAIRDGKPKALEQSAHTLKGSVGNFSTKTAHASAFQLETLGRAGSLDGTDEILRMLEEQLGRLNHTLAGMTKPTVQPSS